VLFTERGSPLGVPIRPAWHILYALWLLCGMTGKEGRKEGRLMLKRLIRWMLPLMVLALIATYFVLSPMVSSHAAGPSNSPIIHAIAPNYLIPNFFRRH